MRARLVPLMLLAASGCKTTQPAGKGSVPLIVGGHELEPDNPGRQSAVVITYDGEFRCSGVLVAERLVMTAAHCLQNQPANGFAVSFADQLSDDRAVSTGVTRVRQFRPWSRQSSAHYDVGWLELATAAPAPYKPVPVLMDPAKLGRGDRLVQVGYGRTSSATHDYGRRYTVDSTFNRHESGKLWRHVFVTGPTPGRGTCEGDSGGPSYVRVDGTWYLAGILFGAPPAMFANARCEDGQDVQTFAGFFKTWVEKTAGVALAPAGASPPIPSLKPRGGAFSQGFDAWCAKATELAPDAWYTVALILRTLKSSECADAAAALAATDRLDLAGAALSEAGPLAGLRSVKTLELANNHLESLAPLAGLTTLERLDVRYNAVKDLAPLAKLTRLESLLAHGNAIGSLAPLAGLTELRTLQVSCNELTSLAPLSTLAKLTTIKASVNQIRDVNVLTRLPKLDLAELFANPIDPGDAAVQALESGTALFLHGSPPPFGDCQDPGWTSADVAF